jgi:hypothetical protein
MEEPYASALTNTTLFKEKQRLSSIKSLGLISQVFPGGTHAKWEHYLGMYSVVTQIELWMKKEEIEKMKWLCLVGGMGQLPFTYATSNSVLLALTLSKEFKNDFKIFVKPIKKICDNCQGNNECDEKPFDVLYKEAGIGSLRGILSGYKISTLPRNIDIGNRDGLILSCFCKNDPVYKLNRVISSYDYMQRDLYHTGIAKFSVGCREVFRSLENGLESLGNSSNLKLLEQLYSYLVNSLYLYPSVACLESSFSKALVQKLCTKELTINELLEFNDDALIKKIGDNLIQELVKRKPIFTVQRDVSADILHLNNVKFESALLGFNKKEYSKLINYPEQDGIIISTYYMGLSDDLEETFRVIVNVLDNKHKLMPFVRVITNMKDYLLQRQEITSKLAEELIYYSFGVNKVSSNYSKVRSSLLGFNNGLNKKEITEIISRTLDIVDECMNKGNLVLGIPYKLESLTKRLRKNNKGMRIIREKTFNYTWERMVLGLLDTYCLFRSKTAGVPEQIGRPTGAK